MQLRMYKWEHMSVAQFNAPSLPSMAHMYLAYMSRLAIAHPKNPINPIVKEVLENVFTSAKHSRHPFWTAIW